MSGGVYSIKQHIAGIVGSVKSCKESSNEDKIKCRKALNEAKIKKKAKQDKDNTLRAEVNISNDETIDLDEMEDSFGNLKPPKSFGPIDRFAKLVDKGTAHYELQDLINTVELPKYKKKLEKFDLAIATKCEVNNEKFDPANWWESYGGSAPNLRKIATRILSLTTSSLEVAKMNNLIYVQANAHLMERGKKIKVRNREILIGEDASEVQEWIVDGDDAHWEAVGDALGVEDELRPQTSARRKERELFEDDFVSESEVEVDEEVDYESDGAQVMEQYGQDED
uniref:HAT C-terminal dimerisation domain-containing protein n=1 Tax=Tanacetum cinerariifolium TaxID=118510 RepID=A0A6L2N6F5_TANCI|nr:hypothetical protein [Tanacetum cinerariifolium]